MSQRDHRDYSRLSLVNMPALEPLQYSSVVSNDDPIGDGQTATFARMQRGSHPLRSLFVILNNNVMSLSRQTVYCCQMVSNLCPDVIVCIRQPAVNVILVFL